MYKPSYYNILKSTKLGKLFLVNTRTTAVLDVSSEPLIQLGNLLVEPNDICDNQYDEKVLQMLLDNGFILPKDFDERKWIEQVHLDARTGKNAFALGVVLTLACNFRCTYCYETHENVDISDHLADKIISLVSDNLNEKERLRIAWFGGEPLLQKDLIESLSKRLLKLCEEKSIIYSSRISTNGYLLTQDVAQLLKDCHVTEVQVTIDGPPEIHDKRRFLANEMPTFNRIYENIKIAADMFDRFIIRINIDNQNAESIPALLNDYLYPLRDKILLTFSVAVSPGSVENIESWTTPPAEFWNIEKNLGLMADNLGFSVMRGYPIPCTSFCMAYQSNSLLIDPYGRINRCPKFLGNKEESYGYLLDDGNIEINKNSMQGKWDLWSPFSDNECKLCKELPLCMGGCLLYLPSEKQKNSTHRCFAKHDMVESILRETDFVELMCLARENKEE